MKNLVKTMVFIFGRPCSGRTHLLNMLKEMGFEAMFFSSDELLRRGISNRQEEYQEASQRRDNGHLVSDKFVWDCIGPVLKMDHGGQPLIVDGFPRTTGQVRLLEHLPAETKFFAIHLVTSKEVCLARFQLRHNLSPQIGDEVFERQVEDYDNETLGALSFFSSKYGPVLEIDGAHAGIIELDRVMHHCDLGDHASEKKADPKFQKEVLLYREIEGQLKS